MNRHLLILAVVLFGCTEHKLVVMPNPRVLAQPPGVPKDIWERCKKDLLKNIPGHPDVPDLTPEDVTCLYHRLMADCADNDRKKASQDGSLKTSGKETLEFRRELTQRSFDFCKPHGLGSERVQRIVEEVRKLNEQAPVEELVCPPESVIPAR